MKYLELRRHSTRIPDTDRLSPEGIALAQRANRNMGPFTAVITSPSNWTYETAVAMGLEVNERYTPVPLRDDQWAELDRLMPPGTPFIKRKETMLENPFVADFAEALRKQWLGIVARYPEDASVLVITHGGYIDNSAVACLMQENPADWGFNFRHCEGLRLTIEENRFEGYTLLREQI